MQGNVVFFAVVFVVTIIAFGGLAFHSLQTMDPMEVPEAVSLGKKVWQEKACVECHTILGHGGYFGPDLTDVWKRLGADRLEDFFREPPLLPGAEKKRHMNLTEEEAQVIIPYLAFLAGIKRAEQWPPKPLFSIPEGR